MNKSDIFEEENNLLRAEYNRTKRGIDMKYKLYYQYNSLELLIREIKEDNVKDESDLLKSLEMAKEYIRYAFGYVGEEYEKRNI